MAEMEIILSSYEPHPQSPAMLAHLVVAVLLGLERCADDCSLAAGCALPMACAAP